MPTASLSTAIRRWVLAVASEGGNPGSAGSVTGRATNRRLRAAAFALVLGVACGGPGASQSDVEAPSPTPAIIKIEGALSTPYLADPGDCQLRETDFVVTGLAEGIIDSVRSKSIIVRGADGNELGSTTTTATPRRISTGDRQGKYEICLAATEWSVQAPAGAGPYVFSVQGVPGAPEPVTLDQLEAREFKCNLHLDTDGRVLEESPCEGGGWIDTFG